MNKFVGTNYPDSKNDLYSIFIERCSDMTCQNGFQAMITMNSWMSLGSFEELRKKIKIVNIINMIHLGKRAFEDIAGEVVQTTAWIQRHIIMSEYISIFVDLTRYMSQNGKEVAFLKKSNFYEADHNKFDNIPGEPYAYWVTEKVLDLYKNARYLADEVTFRRGISTGGNNTFLRLWHEVNIYNTNIKSETATWYMYNKGGGFRKWYGNREYLIYWNNDGARLKSFKGSAVRNLSQQMLPCISYSSIATGKPSFRFFNKFINDQAGNFLTENTDMLYSLPYIMALLNSVVGEYLIKVKKTTQNITADALNAVPVVALEKCNKKQIEMLVQVLIDIAIDDWNEFEVSWDFKCHPMVSVIANNHMLFDDINNVNLMKCFKVFGGECDERFNQLKANEEEINSIFIDIYGLQDEVTSEIGDKDVTVRKADLQRDVKSLLSYAVGCMFGRYSLDTEGLVYAGGEWDASKYQKFPADEDNIIPICDDEYFEDDIVGRLIEFVKVVYGEGSLEENLQFIADALGGKGSSREVIRNYFRNDFFKDHCKIYQKRPIYWLFDSGKKGGFKALIYMHRYQPDTIARMRTDYVHEQQARYRTAIEGYEQRAATASGAERVSLNKKLKTLREQSEELHGYEEKIHHLADQMISIDLDDGVKHNYAIFQDVLAKIK